MFAFHGSVATWKFVTGKRASTFNHCLPPIKPMDSLEEIKRVFFLNIDIAFLSLSLSTNFLCPIFSHSLPMENKKKRMCRMSVLLTCGLRNFRCHSNRSRVVNWFCGIILMTNHMSRSHISDCTTLIDLLLGYCSSKFKRYHPHQEVSLFVKGGL